MFLLLYFFFIGVKNNIVNYKEYSDQMNNGIEYLMRHIYVLITVCYISYSMEYKYFTLGITVVYGIVVSVMMVKNKIIAELFV